MLTKVHLVKAMVFPVVMYGCESWTVNWCFWTVVLEKTLEIPLDCKEIQPVHSEGDQPWDFFGRNDAKAETPGLWPPHAKSWLIGKDPDAGRACGQEEKGMTEDEMAGWHHRLHGSEFERTLGVGDGQGGLACRDSWGHKESDTTEWLNWTEHVNTVFSFLSTFHTVFHSRHNNLHSHQQCRKVPFSLHPVQHLLLIDYSTVAILTDCFLMTEF